VPVCQVGVATQPSSDALDYDYGCAAAALSRLRTDADGLTLELKSPGSYALSISPAIFGAVRCTGLQARRGEAHLFFDAGPAGGSCRLSYAGTLDGLRTLAGRPPL